MREERALTESVRVKIDQIPFRQQSMSRAKYLM